MDVAVTQKEGKYEDEEGRIIELTIVDPDDKKDWLFLVKNIYPYDDILFPIPPYGKHETSFYSPHGLTIVTPDGKKVATFFLKDSFFNEKSEMTISFEISEEGRPGPGYELMIVMHKKGPIKKRLFIAQGDVPLSLLPVRLETRFVKKDYFFYELLVRIYPDAIHLDNHKTSLSKREIEVGKSYWQERKSRPEDIDAERQAWEMLVGECGIGRAQWIRDMMEEDGRKARPIEERPRWGAFVRALPERWVVTCYRAGERVVWAEGGRIANDLTIDIKPEQDPEKRSESPLAADSKWIVDFEAALERGMALRVPITADMYTKGFDQVFVFGIRNQTPDLAGEELDNLLRAHFYTDGLSLVRPGTPTNNTEDTSAGKGSNVRDALDILKVHQKARAMRSAQVESPYATKGKEMEKGTDQDDGTLLMRAFGINENEWRDLQYFSDLGQLDAKCMNTLIWDSTLGYYLAELTGKSKLSDLRAVRQHFIEYVRGRGPLPAMRVGRQPYGILPVELSHSAIDFTDPVKGALSSFQKVWDDAVRSVPSLGWSAGYHKPEDYDLVLMKALRMESIPHHFMLRTFHGDEYVVELLKQIDTTKTRQTILKEISQIRSNLPDSLHQVKMINGWYMEQALPLRAPLVQYGVLSETDAIYPSYLNYFLKATPKEIANYGFMKDKDGNKSSMDKFVPKYLEIPNDVKPFLRFLPTPLLFQMVRQSYLRLMAGAYSEGRQKAKDPSSDEILPLDANVKVEAKFQHPISEINKLDDVKKFKSFMKEVITDEGREEIEEFRGALEYLSKRPSALVERCLRESLDLSSTRLDAWMTSYATRALEKLRDSHPNGIYIGAYGWVEDVRSTIKNQISEWGPEYETINSLTDLKGAPIYLSGESKGFVHAPSMAHAATAAILLSGYLSHIKEGTVEGCLNIKLTSSKVRRGLRVLEGIRNGLYINALLGLEFERVMHAFDKELAMDSITYLMRQTYPALLVDREMPQNIGITEQPMLSVVDGYTLCLDYLGTIKRDGMPPDVEKLLNNVKFKGIDIESNDQKTALKTALDSLVECADAVSDLLLAESVYQMVQGNYSRASASLSSVATGERPPSDIEFVKSRRSGLGIEQKVMVLLPTMESKNLDLWPRGRDAPRAVASPQLNNWIADLFGDPRSYHCQAQATITENEGEEVKESVDVCVSDLGLCPLDCVILASRQDWEGGEMMTRVLESARSKLEGENKVVRNIGLDLKWPMKPFGNGMPFGRLVLVARDIMPLIASRPLDATDLATVNEISEERKKGYDPRKIDVIELVERAKKVSDLFISSINELKDLVPEWPQQRELNSDERGKLRSRLHILAGFGRPECLPTMEAITSDNTGPSEEESWRAYSAWNTLDNAKVIIEEKLKALVDLGERTADAEKGARDLLSMMFGPMFPVIPLFNPLHEELLNANLHQSRSRQGEDDLLSHEWMRRMGKVRSNLALFQEVMIGASGLGGSDQLILRVCQLPDVRAKGEVEPWVGWKMEKERMPKGGRLSLVMHIPWLGVDSSNDPEQIISPAEPISGLMIDQWNEVIPSPTETTALVFNHSTPAACAPQTILLAVMEQNGSQKPPNWTLQGLETLLRSTLQQAKMRGVDLTMTKGTGQILPANFFTYNEKNATVSTDILGADKEGAEAISRFRRVVG